MMTQERRARLEQSIVVAVPIGVAYGQWTRFEDFPRFMEGIEQVARIDPRRLRWQAEVGGRRFEWLAEIVELRSDRLVAWRSVSGAPNEGTVSFDPLGDRTTRVSLALSYEPRGFVERIGKKLGTLERLIQADLEHFKDRVETPRLEPAEEVWLSAA